MAGIIQPHVKEVGAGSAVLCLHANASHCGQWKGLMGLLAPDFRVLAVDSYGAGLTPDWHSDRTIALLFPHRVKALALFEPTFFSVVEHESPTPNDVDGIRRLGVGHWRFAFGGAAFH